MSLFDDFLFSWLGLTIMITIILLISAKSKVASLVFMPLCLFLGLAYFQNVAISNNLMWGGVIFLLITMFLGIRVVKGD